MICLHIEQEPDYICYRDGNSYRKTTTVAL